MRIGTCGSIQSDVLADQPVLSTHAIGLDGLLNFYQLELKANDAAILEAFKQHSKWSSQMNAPYLVAASTEQLSKFSQLEGINLGMTITAPGFYGPQGRSIRLKPALEDQNAIFSSFSHDEHRFVNYEMETSALFGLSQLLGHNAATICLVVANRSANSFSKNYKESMREIVEKVLTII